MTKTAKNSRYGEAATAEVLRKLRASEAPKRISDKPLTTNELIALFREVLDEPKSA